MPPKIITQQMRDNLGLLEQVGALIVELSQYPSDFTIDQIHRGDRIGSRQLLWSVWALNSLAVDRSTRSLLDIHTVDSVAQFVQERYRPGQTRRDAKTPFWRASIIHAIGLLNKLCSTMGAEDGHDATSKLLRHYQAIANEVTGSISRAHQDPLNWYWGGWAYLGLRQLFVLGMSFVPSRKFFTTTKEDIHQQIALHSCNQAKFNPIRLALSAAILWEHDHTRSSLADVDATHLLRRAAEIGLASSRSAPATKRLAGC